MRTTTMATHKGRGRRRPYRVQIALPNLNSVYSEIFVGIHAFARQHTELNLVGVLPQADAVARAGALSIDGLVGAFYRGPALAGLLATGLPAVNVSNRSSDVPLPRVVSDDEAAGRMAARHLLDCGFRRFAFAGFPGHQYSDQRRTGFVRETQAAGCTCDVLPPESAASDGEPGLTPLARWLQTLPRPLAVMACSDVRACHVLLACEPLGLRVPEDVAVLGVDNDSVRCRVAAVPLSSVALNGERVGWMAAELLLRLMRGEPPPAKPILVPPLRVVVRQSTDVIAAADPLVARAVRYIREHAGDPELDVAAVTRGVGASDRALRRRFEAALGWSPYHELVNTRLTHARRLLIETDLSVKNIAPACGFADPRRFTIVFRRVTGMTATAFREQARV